MKRRATEANRLAAYTDLIRRGGVGVLSGIVGGLVTGIGARIAMRIVADAIGKFPEFTVEGTLLIIILGMVIGIAFGLVFVAVKRFVPGAGLVRGLIFGGLLLIVFGLPTLLPPARGELALAPGLLGKYLFGSLFVVCGTVIALVERWIDRVMPTPRVGWVSVVGYGALLALGALGLVLFGFAFVGALLGVES